MAKQARKMSGWTALGIGLALGGCASANGAQVGEPLRSAPVPADEVRVVVENTNARDAALYVLREGRLAQRIGDVPGNGSTRSFAVPWAFAEDIAFRIDLIAGGSCATSSTVVGPGDAIDLRIVPDFLATDCR